MSSDNIAVTLMGVAVGMSVFIAVVAIVVACILWQRTLPFKSSRLHSIASPPGVSEPRLEAGMMGRSPSVRSTLSDRPQSVGKGAVDRGFGEQQRGGARVDGESRGGSSEEWSGSSFDIQRVVQFGLKELQDASENFSYANRLGEGSYGMVYKARLKGGELVAVKRAKQDRKQDESKFQKEVELLSRVSHKHLVRLVGYCKEGVEQLLVYEYIAGGNLSQNLNRQWRAKNNCTPLTWTERLMVAAGVGRALSYLHEEINTPFIHRDVKASNILIDRNVVAKLADFGTTKPMTADELRKMSTCIQGTAGYCDPDYLKSGVSSKRIDVYSFGIVLLELITGEGPHKIVKPFRFYVEDKLRRYGLDVLVDQSMGQYSKEEVQHILDLAFRCTDLSEPELRPSMGRVVSEIEAVLEPERRFRTTSLALASPLTLMPPRPEPASVAGMRSAQFMLPPGAVVSTGIQAMLPPGAQAVVPPPSQSILSPATQGTVLPGQQPAGSGVLASEGGDSVEWSQDLVSSSQPGSFDPMAFSFGDVRPA